MGPALWEAAGRQSLHLYSSERRVGAQRDSGQKLDLRLQRPDPEIETPGITSEGRARPDKNREFSVLGKRGSSG